MTAVASPPVGLWRDADHWYSCFYPDAGIVMRRVPSVTRAISVMDKRAVAIWRGNTVAEWIADNLSMYGELIASGGRDAAVKYAASLPNYQRDKAADTGSLVHVLVEKILRRKAADIGPDLEPYAVAFRRFLSDRQLRPSHFLSVERMVANVTDGWAGTFDFLVKLPQTTLVDVKTWRKRPVPGSDIYAETAIQLAAYGHAEFTGIAADPKRYAPPRPDAYAVLHLRPDLYESGYQLYPIDVTDAEYDAFLGLLAALRWRESRSKLVIREPMNGVTP